MCSSANSTIQIWFLDSKGNIDTHERSARIDHWFEKSTYNGVIDVTCVFEYVHATYTITPSLCFITYRHTIEIETHFLQKKRPRQQCTFRCGRSGLIRTCLASKKRGAGAWSTPDLPTNLELKCCLMLRRCEAKHQQWKQECELWLGSSGFNTTEYSYKLFLDRYLASDWVCRGNNLSFPAGLKD